MTELRKIRFSCKCLNGGAGTVSEDSLVKKLRLGTLAHVEDLDV
jgi:hypothetical protein